VVAVGQEELEEMMVAPAFRTMVCRGLEYHDGVSGAMLCWIGMRVG
jgi:hypothetical protein